MEFIRLQFTDMSGTMKNMAITAGQLEHALDNKCTFDGSAFEGFAGVEESDMYLHPDPTRLRSFRGAPSRVRLPG